MGRAERRLERLERRSGKVLCRLLQVREGFAATADGVTHAPFAEGAIARADFETDDAFWAGVRARGLEAGENVMWVHPEDADL